MCNMGTVGYMYGHCVVYRNSGMYIIWALCGVERMYGHCGCVCLITVVVYVWASCGICMGTVEVFAGTEGHMYRHRGVHV